VLPIEEIYSLHPDEWVLVQVTGTAPSVGITHGRVLAHSRQRRPVSRALIRAHAEHPGIHTYLFYGDVPPVRVEVIEERAANAPAPAGSPRRGHDA
jgi:hypothetical protein